MTSNAPEQWMVVVNDQGRFALLPEGRAVPAGWRPAGFSGTEQDCIAHVDSVVAAAQAST